MSKFPGWRTMSHVQRRNAKMHAMFDRARELGVTGLYSGDKRDADARKEQEKANAENADAH